MSGLAFLLFGYPQITIDGQIVDIRSRKGLALLAYLAVTGSPQSRDVIAGLLWPEYNQTRARANLRRTLFNLNRTVASDWLISAGEMIDLRPEIRGAVDVVRFQKLTASGDVDDLEAATSLYRDAFLAGYYLPDSQPFDAWAAELRARTEREMLETLERFTQHNLDNGEFDHAIAQARRQLELDNLRESAWRQLMTALARTGQRSEALAEFEHCRQVLADELGVDPAEATAALAESIRGNRSDVVPSVAVDSPSLEVVDELRTRRYRSSCLTRPTGASSRFGKMTPHSSSAARS